jgi:hypothetical protein
LEKIFGLVAEVAFDQIIRNPFFRQDKPCPVSVGSGAVRKELHKSHLRVIALYHLRAAAATFLIDPQKFALLNVQQALLSSLFNASSSRSDAGADG